MTEALAALFEEKEIHIIERNGDIWFPLLDLAGAWGIDKTTPHNLIHRNLSLFAGMVDLNGGDVTSPTAEEFVNERGLYLLIGKISADRLKNPNAKEAIIRFQRWVPELIQKYRKKEIVQVSTTQNLRAELEEARELAEICGKPPEQFQAIILRKHGKPELAEALQLQSAHGETGWYNPSGLVELCNDPHLTPERLNQFLANYRENGEWKPFQYRDGRLWRLTKRGMDHGREYQFNLGNGHSEPRISWRESILYAAGLKRDIAQVQNRSVSAR